MRQGTLALYDSNEAYIQALGEYLSSGKLPLDIEVFTRLDKLAAYAKEVNPGMLVADESIASQFSDIPAGIKVVLTASMQEKTVDGYPAIGKFQAADAIQGRIAALLTQAEPAVRNIVSNGGENRQGVQRFVDRPGEGKSSGIQYAPPAAGAPSGIAETASLFRATSPPVWSGKTAAAIRGVYSPVGRCGKTTFALTLGEILGEEKRVLYLNMEDYSALADRDRQTEGTLTDLMYYARQQDDGLVFKLGSMVHTWKNLDYILPPLVGAELHTLSAADWTLFLRRLAAESDYDLLILDIGAQIDELPVILNLCERVYVPVLQEATARQKVNRFMEMLQRMGQRDLLRRMIRLTLPALRSEEEMIQPARLPKTAMGDFVRRLLSMEKKAQGNE